MQIIQTILYIILGILALNAGYIFLFSLIGLLPLRKNNGINTKQGNFAVLFPAYQYDDLILESAISALDQVYPKTHYTIYVIADKLQAETISKLKSEGIVVFEVTFEKSTKAKSLNYAFASIDAHLHDYALILDIDNIMEPNFLEKLNQSHQSGFKAVQGHRATKNMNTNFAILDAISEEINNHIHRKAHRVVGLASILIGSGMSFEYVYLKDIMRQIVSSVEDKEIEMAILQKGDDIAYLEDAYVYDEKVAKSAVFANQRIRWVYSQLYALKRHFLPGMKALFKGNMSYFFKVVELMLIPKVMLLGFLLLFTMVTAIIDIHQPIVYYSTLTLILYIVALILAVPGKFWNKQTLQAVFSIPKAFILMTATLFKLKKAKESFIPTHHEKTS